MRLARLSLRNVKRFAALDLEFASGLNVLKGGNGAGKTTVLEAIGFALFGAPLSRGSHDATAAIRDRAGWAEVELALETGSERLIVRRRIEPGGGTATLSEAPSGQELARGEGEVARVLAARLGIDGRGPLPAPAGLAGVLLADAVGRRAHFDAVLDLGRYRRVADRARSLGEPFRAEAHRLELEAARGEGTLKGYRETAARLEAIAAAASAAGERLGEARARLDQLGEESLAAEERRRAVEALDRERAVVAEALRSRCAEEARVRSLLEEAEEATRMVDRAHAAHNRWESLEAECRVLELQRAGHDDLRLVVTDLEGRLERERETIGRERSRLAAQLDDNQRASESILAERDGIRARLEGLRGRARRLEGARNALAIAIERTAALQQLLAGVEPAPAEAGREDHEATRREDLARRAEQAATAAAAEAHQAEVQALSARAETEDDARNLLREASETALRLEKVLAAVKDHLGRVAPAAGACPFFNDPCQNVAGKSLVDHFTAAVTRHEASTASAAEAVRFAEARLGEARAAREQLAEKAAASRSAPRRATARTVSAPRSRPTAGVGRKVAFDEIGHHLSALSGVLGAIEPQVDREPVPPRALIGSVAGEGQSGPAHPPPAEPGLELPAASEIEEARALAHEAELALRQPATIERDAHLGSLARRLARATRRIHAATTAASAEARRLLAENRAAARAGEERLLDTTRSLESLSLERARNRAASKELSSQDLTVLDLELQLSERRLKLGALARLERETAAKREEQANLLRDRDAYRAHALLADRAETYRDEWKSLEHERQEAATRLARLDGELGAARQGFDPDGLTRIAAERDALHAGIGELIASERGLEHERQFLAERLAEMEEGRRQLLANAAARSRALAAGAAVDRLAGIYREMTGPVAAAIREQVGVEANRLYRRVAGGTATLRWDDDFDLWRSEDGTDRPFSELARGDQATLAIALLLALQRQVPRLGVVWLDEPTAHLDHVRRAALARALPEFRAAAGDVVEQVVVTAHDAGFDGVADRVIELDTGPPGSPG